MEISKESILKAIEKIDSNPNLQKGRTSSTYDLVYNNRKYPPILVLSEANKVNGGKEVYLEDFKNGTSEAFKYLTDFGFEIVKKHESYYDELLKFLQQSKTDELKISNYKKGFEGLKVKVSFGMGVPANIPWISFLRDGISTNDGIYPVYLYFKKEKLLILSYGISETNIPKYEWPIINPTTINKFFVQKYTSTPYRYGKSYIFKSYSVDNLPQKEIIDKDLHEIINFYKSLSLEEKNTRLTKPEIKLQNSLTSEETNMSSLQIDFNYKSFHKRTEAAGLIFSEKMVARFVASLCTKPFVILSGLSGSGKTKLAQAFVHWICENETQYKIVPVGADWTNREPLVGYPNGLVAEEYITPDSGVIHLLMEAVKSGNKNKPFFLILDEMNLSHVERYFADFLSIMESNDTIKLYTGNKRKSLDGLEIDLEINWPKNVFIIGTVNIDETTYMFSPKVLDRANVIEFRITEDEINGFLASPGIPDLKKLKGQGIAMAESFLSIAEKGAIEKNEALTKELVYFFNELKKVGAEFGYRSAAEIMQLAAKLKMLEPSVTDDDCLDIAIMQKLLPKLHGSRSKLVKILIALAGLCIEGMKKEEFEKQFDDNYKNNFDGISIKYPISFEKIIRMYKNVLANGFTSYAEA